MRHLERRRTSQATLPGLDQPLPGIGRESDWDEDDDVLDRNRENETFEQFLGINRNLTPGRVREIEEYVNTVDATFPTAIILAVSSGQAAYDPERKTLSVIKDERSAKIIDGQHRIAGLKSYRGSTPFQVNVVVFVDMELQEQAMVFATINLKQTKVNPSLAVDLYEFTKERSPQRSAHDIVRFLNNRDGSPFQGKIKMLGVATESGQTLTQATFVRELLRLISSDPMRDRDLIKREGLSGLRALPGLNAPSLIFRPWFLADQDAKIARQLWSFFRAVANRWPTAWRSPDSQVSQPSYVLCRTVGFLALMRLLRTLFPRVSVQGELISEARLTELLAPVRLTDDDFRTDDPSYQTGSSGVKVLFDRFMEDLA